MSIEPPGSGRRIFRRKKRFQGASWTPPSMSAGVGEGIWCRRCRLRHGYKAMRMQYEKSSKGQWVLLWSCPQTHDVIGRTELTRTEQGQTDGTDSAG